MCGVHHRHSCRYLFRKMGILTTASQYIYSMLIFVCKNPSIYQDNSKFHDYNTRNKNNLHIELKRLTLVQKGVYYSSIKLFNVLPPHIKCLHTELPKFKQSLKDYLIEKSFYTVDEYLEENVYYH